MRKSIIFFLLAAIAWKVDAQKLYSNYVVYSDGGDSTSFVYKTLSDGKIQAKLQRNFLDTLPAQFRNSSKILVDQERLFSRVSVGDTTQLLRVLALGYHQLYLSSAKKSKEYFVINEKDTIKLSKVDVRDGRYLREDRSYQRKLNYLSTSYPDLSKKSEKVKYLNPHIQSHISLLNEKNDSIPGITYPSNTKRSFLYVGLKGLYSDNKTDLTLDVQLLKYYFDFSENVSLRLGASASYFKETYLSKYTTITWLVRNRSETYEHLYAGIPLLMNFELTNSFFTPYFYAGVMPMYYHYSIENERTRTEDSRFRISIRGGVGAKLKFSENFNALAEYKYESATSFTFNLGLEYCIEMRKK